MMRWVLITARESVFLIIPQELKVFDRMEMLCLDVVSEQLQTVIVWELYIIEGKCDLIYSTIMKDFLFVSEN